MDDSPAPRACCGCRRIAMVLALAHLDVVDPVGVEATTSSMSFQWLSHPIFPETDEAFGSITLGLDC